MFIPFSKKYVKNYWENSEARIHGSTNKKILQKNYIQYAKKIYKLTPNQNEVKEILDVGCADGSLSQELSNIFKASVEGLEQSKKLIKKFQEKNLGKYYLQSCTDEWLNIEKKYDLIVINGVLQYLTYPEIKKLSNNAASSLKKGGKVVIVGICDLDNLLSWYLKNTEKKSTLQKILRFISFGGIGALLTCRLWPDGSMWHNLRKIKRILECKFNYLNFHYYSGSYRVDIVCSNEKI